MTKSYTNEEKADLKRIANAIGMMPSPRDTSWRHYIEHRLAMSQNGIEAYSQRPVARLHLDKHIEWHRAIDRIAGKLVRHKAAIIFMGAAEIAANSIISIKKYVRCPGTRKLIQAFKNRGNCIVRLVDEYSSVVVAFDHFHDGQSQNGTSDVMIVIQIINFYYRMELKRM